MELTACHKPKKRTGVKRPLVTSDLVEQPSTKKSKAGNKKKSKDNQLVIQDTLVEQPEVSIKKEQPFQTKCRPQKLVELINNLNKEQKKAVRDIGFGGLLDLKLNKIPHGILKLLLKRFDHTCKMVKTKKLDFLLTKHDVHDIFLLPREGIPVEVAQTGNTGSLEDTQLKNVWRKKFGVTNTSAPIMVKDVHDRLMNCNDAGDEFKRMFVIYSLSIFLAPSSNKSLDLKFVKAVKDVKRIRKFDWCTYVFEEMVRSIKVCKEGAKSLVSGCILVLMLAYLHRFYFKGKVSPHTLPLIKHWDDKELTKRVDAEKITGSLGNAPISKTEYPNCVHQQETLEVEFNQDSQPEAAAQMQTKEGYMLVKLPSGVETDEQIGARAMDSAHEIYLRIKRDNELFMARYVYNMRKLMSMKPTTPTVDPTTSTKACAREDDATKDGGEEDGAEQDDAEEEVHNTEGCTPLDQTPTFMKDPGFHALMDMLVARKVEQVKAQQGLPSFDISTDMLKILYKELNRKYGGCTDKDLLSSDDELDCNNKKQDDVTNLDSDGDDSEHDEQDIDLDSNLDDVINNIRVGATDVWDDEAEVLKMNEDTNVVNQLTDVVSNVDVGVTSEKGNERETGGEEEEMNEEVTHDTTTGKGIEKEPVEKEYTNQNLENVMINEEVDGETVEAGTDTEKMNEDSNKDLEAGMEINQGVNQETPNEKSIEDEKMKNADVDVGLNKTGTKNILDYLLHSNVKPESAAVIPNDLGCTLDCGLPEKCFDLVSQWLYQREHLFDDVLKLRKDVMDYCFLADHTIKKSEIVCDFGTYHEITKSDIESMLPNTKIEAVVMESWIILLNEFERARTDDKPRRIFYGLAYSMKRIVRKWTKLHKLGKMFIKLGICGVLSMARN